jgi:hypothetical protein
MSPAPAAGFALALPSLTTGHDLPDTIMDIFITAMFYAQVSRYTLLAGVVAWAYDISLTLDDEVALVWTKGSTAARRLYLVVSKLQLF